MRFSIFAITFLLMAALVSCTSQSEGNAEDDKSDQPGVSDADAATFTSEGTIFTSPSGISIEQFTTALGSYVAIALRRVVTDLQMEDFRQGVRDGISGIQQPRHSIEAMSTALAKTETVQQEGDPPYSPAEEEKPVISYALGFIQGTQMQQMGVQLSVESFVTSFAGSYANGSDAPEASEEIIRTYLTELQQANQSEIQTKLGANLAQSKVFLDNNRGKAGIEETASGLQYEVLVQGEGKSPIAEDTVQVHYSGTLVDGTEFDSSYKRDQPAEFPLRAVIPGWTEGLQLMQAGSKYRFYIPPALGYGERGSPPNIGPNELLIFEVELLDIL